MDFQQLLAACSFSAAELEVDPLPSGSPEIQRITDDSRAVDEAAVFVLTEEGRPYVRSAIQKKPAAVLAGRDRVDSLRSLRDELAPATVLLLAEDLLFAQGRIASCLHGDPSRRLAITGITGTNGKTSTAFMLYHIWSELDIPAGLIGTLGVRWRPAPGTGADRPGEVELQTGYTTPRSGQLHELLARMAADGVERVAMEVSSEALALGRLEGTTFRRAVFTNLTPEHLDYHGDMDAYFAAKMRLFDKTLASDGELIVYTGAPGGERAAGYARDRAEASLATLSEPIVAAGELALPAFFHRINASLALSAAGLDADQMPRARRALATLPGIPGRYTVVRAPHAGRDRYGVVDYAHSPDGLENVLRACRAEGVRRLVCVFGCGGDRDATKRPLMGACAARYADAIIVTDDNPRTEDPDAIRAAIHAGIREELEGTGESNLNAKANATEPRANGTRPDQTIRAPEIHDIGDRRAAIRAGVDWMYAQAEGPAVVLVAGKGHESVQIFADRREPFSDRDVLAELLGAEHPDAKPGPAPQGAMN